MHAHIPPGARAARSLPGRAQGMLAGKALVAPTALKRLESESGLKVREDTRGAGPQPPRSQCIAPW